MVSDNKIHTLAIAAKNKQIRGGLSYQLSLHGSKKILDLFFDVFQDKLHMKYPCSSIDGICIENNESVIHLICYSKTDSSGQKIDERVEIIDSIHETLNEKVGGDGWFTTIGRS